MKSSIESETRFIPVACPVLSGNEKKYVNECLDSSWISSAGKFISQFEEAFAAFCGVRYAVSSNNGTTALHLALLALGAGPGDEVIVPTLTYIASANAIRYCGAHPVFVDSEPRTMNIDPFAIEKRITSATKGIMVVHLYGHPVDIDPILEIARRHNLFVIEDAAEAHGATYRGRTVGGLGDAGTFSFFGNKIITTGEGGMITTDRADLNDRLRLLRGQGMDLQRRYWFPVIGYNYRMTNIEAALGLAQLERVEEHRNIRQSIAAWYNNCLADLSDVITTPIVEDWAYHAFWMYTIILKDACPVTRDELMARLAARGIETRPVFYPMHVLPPYLDSTSKYPVADFLSTRGINLPTHELLTEGDVRYIVGQIRSCL